MNCLETVSVDDLVGVLSSSKKPVERVLAGLAYEYGVSQTTSAECHDSHPTTGGNWPASLD